MHQVYSASPVKLGVLKIGIKQHVDANLTSCALSWQQAKKITWQMVQLAIELRYGLPENVGVLENITLFSPDTCFKPFKMQITDLVKLLYSKVAR